MSTSSDPCHAFVTTVLYPTAKPTGFRILQSDFSPLVVLVAPRWDLGPVDSRGIHAGIDL